MSISFGGKAVTPATISELNARGNVNAFNKWFASRSVWVKLVSRSTGCSDPKLKTMSSLDRFIPYESGYTGGRPYPIITGVRVASAGSLGTIREATINMIAFTPDQLDQLESCYLIPQMSVMVLFGWTVGATDSLTAAAINVSGVSDSEVTCAIKKAWPLADGVQGRVAKYDVSFNKEGMWWDITIKIVGASNAVMTLPAEDFTSTCECDTVSTPAGASGDDKAGEAKTTEVSGFKMILTNLADYAFKQNSDSIKAYSRQFGAEKGTYYAMLTNKNRWKTTLYEDITGYIPFFEETTKFLGVGGYTSMESYISIDALLKALEKRSLSKDASGNPIYGKFDNTKGGAMSLPPSRFLKSSNPHKAIFPTEIYEGLDAPSCIENGKCYVGGILVNVIFAYECLKDCGKNATIQDFMSRILQGVNDASGNLWELTIIDNGAGCERPIFSIIDLQSVEKVDATLIKIDPKTAIVREVNLALKMTDAMQSQALYGGTRSQTTDQACSNTRWGKLLKDFKNEADPNGVGQPEPPPCEQNASLGCKDVAPYAGGYKQFEKKLLEMRKETGNEDLKESCYTEQVRMNNEVSRNSKTPQQCANVMLPYEFSFSVDGIGGFEFGQMVTSNILPKVSQKYYVYQVSSVEHDLTHGDWKTTIKTIPRYK